MRASESRSQPDLFAPVEEKEPLFAYTLPDYILELRRPEAQKMLQLVQDATEFPWKNLTVAACEEMKFNGMARLFPLNEGLALLEAYAVEIKRLYNHIGEPWTPLYYAVLQKLYV